MQALKRVSSSSGASPVVRQQQTLLRVKTTCYARRGRTNGFPPRRRSRRDSRGSITRLLGFISASGGHTHDPVRDGADEQLEQPASAPMHPEMLEGPPQYLDIPASWYGKFSLAEDGLKADTPAPAVDVLDEDTNPVVRQGLQQEKPHVLFYHSSSKKKPLTAINLLLASSEVLKDIPQIHVIMFGKGNEGLYALKGHGMDGAPHDTVLAFQCEEEAERYATILGATMRLDSPQVRMVPSSRMVSFCRTHAYQCQLERRGSGLVPPDSCQPVTDWERFQKFKSPNFWVMEECRSPGVRSRRASQDETSRPDGGLLELPAFKVLDRSPLQSRRGSLLMSPGSAARRRGSLLSLSSPRAGSKEESPARARMGSGSDTAVLERPEVVEAVAAAPRAPAHSRALTGRLTSAELDALKNSLEAMLRL